LGCSKNGPSRSARSKQTARRSIWQYRSGFRDCRLAPREKFDAILGPSPVEAPAIEAPKAEPLSPAPTTAETINDPIVDVSPAPAAAAKKPNGKLKAAKEVKPTFDDPIPEKL
jgi:hypothetical protein